MPLAANQQLLWNLNGLEIGHLHSERSEDSEEEELVYVTARPKDDPLFHYLDGEMGDPVWPSPINERPERERLIMALYYYEERTMKAIGSRRCTPPPCCTVELGSPLPQFSKGHKTNQAEVAWKE
jgi:RNA polymerase sigma factor FliA